jgi:hypothetical protein
MEVKMKPEVTAGAVLEGRPNLTRVKRVARFVTEAVSSLPKPAEALEQRQLEKIDTETELLERGRSFLNALRSSFGDSLSEGIILRPNHTDSHEVQVEASTEDTDRYHQTAAAVEIMSNEGHVTRFIVGATEPTRAARYLPGAMPRLSWVRVLDPTDPGHSYDSVDFNEGEQAGLLEVAGQVFDEVERACDQGDLQLYSQVS